MNEEIKKTKLYISTLDPARHGGVTTVAKFVYDQAKERGFNPNLIYNIIRNFRDEKEPGKLLGFLRGFRASAHREEKLGMNGYGIDRILPEFEFFNYLLNLKAWDKATEDGEIFFAASGSDHCALSFATSRKNFSVWVATTLYEDRVDRLKNLSLIRKIREYASLPPLFYLEKFIFKRAKRILAVSRYTKDCIVKKYAIPENKIDVASFPINDKQFYPIPPEQRENDYLLFTGRINDQRKNIHLLISAFSKIQKEFPRLKLKLSGEAPNNELIKMVKDAGVVDAVEFVGFLAEDKFPLLYQNALLFVIPSLQEGLCISGLEAMACGIPVISTRCGGPEDFVIDGETGFLVNNNDETAMVEKVKHFLSLDEFTRHKLGANARANIQGNNSVEKIWNKLENCFKLSQ